jgi:hypothetical protein
MMNAVDRMSFTKIFDDVIQAIDNYSNRERRQIGLGLALNNSPSKQLDRIASITAGLDLERSTFELLPFANGSRDRTSPCPQSHQKVEP